MLQRDQTALVVIDFQEKLLPAIHDGDDLVAPTVKLMRFAQQLALPILCTEQYPKGLGSTVAEIGRALDGVVPLAKTEFGCMANGPFAEALGGTGRKQVLVTGIEAHVCVMQTVLRALDEGYEVFVVQDAVGSRRVADREAGLARMARAGAELVTAEMAMFEILGKAGTAEFKSVLPLLK
jgi:nicotinamidase-related amidase